jgi:probable phosphoglycerate mutase
MAGVAEIVLVRHGQTEWSATGRHTSYSDPPLTRAGERQAEALRPVLAGRQFAAVLCSPRRRATRTAELAGLAVTAVDDDLVEWDYGEYEGITTPQIRAGRPDWDLWRDGCPGGESPEQVGARLDRLLAEARELAGAGEVVLVGHGHSLRVAAARWVGLAPSVGAALYLGTATVSRLGYEHSHPVIRQWNAPVD